LRKGRILRGERVGIVRREGDVFIYVFGKTTWPPGLITIFELRPRQQQQAMIVRQHLVKETAGRSAGVPHGVFKCELKLRRGISTPRYEDDERGGRKAISQMGI
jgi:hypothetical protein